ncbi:MAG TPA: RHS repeat-associated core domain-containing protein [Rhizomicrobium sp.]
MQLSFNLGATTISYTYDPSHARASQTESVSGTITNYADYPEIGVMAELIQTGSTLTWRNYIMADGHMVAIRFATANKDPMLYYPILDHLGSMVALVDGNAIGIAGANPNYGQVIDRYSYDAFGMARDPVNWKPLDCSKGPQPPFVRGFTGQEHLPDNVCLINFNARLYDPQIGRFLSADPTVEAIYDGQDLNRYSYVDNNPLGFTDASGLCFMGCFYKSPIFGAALDVGLFFFGLPELEVLTNLATIGGTATTAYAAASAANLTVINAGIAGGLSGAVTSGRLKGALMGAAQGMAMQGAAPGLGHALGTVIANPVADDFIAHGFVGGLFNVGQKGGFVSGFLAAGVGSLPAPIPLDQYSTGLEMATLGGAASVLGGGKFANGAITAAFSYAAGMSASPESDSGGGPNESRNGGSGSGQNPAFMGDPSVRGALNIAWIDSNPDAPSVPADQCCSLKHEQGGWIIKWVWGGYDTLRVDPGTRDSLPTILNTRPEWCMLLCGVEGWFHTHPNWNSEGYDGYRASPGDIEFTRGYAKVPGVIMTHQNPIIIPYP